ncbi:MAG: hypothetical protein ACLFVP_10075 [Candidatus Bathyarchaeia archaeon]
MFTKGFLRRVKGRAFRRRVWYSALDRAERGILDLTSRLVDVVRSKKLGVTIVKILAKLREAMKSPFVKHIESYGLERASRVAEQAAEFGYSGASDWRMDLGFARYLALIDYNKPSGWGY